MAQQARRREKRSEELSSAQLSRALTPLALRALVREYGFSVEESLEYLRRAAGNLPQPADQAVPLAMWDARPSTSDPVDASNFQVEGAAKPRKPSRRRPAPEKTA
jgi:hypothetical protein